MESRAEAVAAAEAKAEEWKREAMASINRWGTVDKETHARVVAARAAAEAQAEKAETALSEQVAALTAAKDGAVRGLEKQLAAATEVRPRVCSALSAASPRQVRVSALHRRACAKARACAVAVARSRASLLQRRDVITKHQ